MRARRGQRNWQDRGQQRHERGGASRLTLLLPGLALGRHGRLTRSRAGNRMPTKEAMCKDNIIRRTLFAGHLEELPNPEARVLRDKELPDPMLVFFEKLEFRLLGSASMVKNATDEVAHDKLFPRIKYLLQGKLANADLLHLRIAMHVEPKSEVSVGVW